MAKGPFFYPRSKAIFPQPGPCHLGLPALLEPSNAAQSQTRASAKHCRVKQSAVRSGSPPFTPREPKHPPLSRDDAVKNILTNHPP